MLTDYYSSIAVGIPHLKAGEANTVLPVQVMNCSGYMNWDGKSTIGDIFAYGPRLSLAYLIWHALCSRGAIAKHAA